MALADDFARACAALSSPFSDPAARHAADEWLSAFKRSPESWAVAQQALQQAAPGPDTTLQAAQILAWKSKKQLGQLGLAQQAALAEALAGLLAGGAAGGGGGAPLRRALCVALANLAIQQTDWVRPLETLGERNGSAGC